MSKVINCDCGFVVRGADDTELLANARNHIADAHQEMVGQLTDDQLLSMSEEEAASPS